MTSYQNGTNILKTTSKSEVEVVSVEFNGINIVVLGNKYFLPFEKFHWFKKASMEQIFNVDFKHGYHLRWNELDIDLELESLIHPEKYPLVWHE